MKVQSRRILAGISCEFSKFVDVNDLLILFRKQMKKKMLRSWYQSELRPGSRNAAEKQTN
jgi:hypothetical protein